MNPILEAIIIVICVMGAMLISPCLKEERKSRALCTNVVVHSEGEDLYTITVTSGRLTRIFRHCLHHDIDVLERTTYWWVGNDFDEICKQAEAMQ